MAALVAEGVVGLPLPCVFSQGCLGQLTVIAYREAGRVREGKFGLFLPFVLCEKKIFNEIIIVYLGVIGFPLIFQDRG